MLASRSFSSASAMRVERCPALSLLSCGEGVCGGVCDGNKGVMNGNDSKTATINGMEDKTARMNGTDKTTARILTLKQLPSLRWFSAGEKAFSHVECVELESGCVRGL